MTVLRALRAIVIGLINTLVAERVFGFEAWSSEWWACIVGLGLAFSVACVVRDERADASRTTSQDVTGGSKDG